MSIGKPIVFSKEDKEVIWNILYVREESIAYVAHLFTCSEGDIRAVWDEMYKRMKMSRSDIKIEDCFWYKEGKCRSPELYRFHPDCEQTSDCPFDFESTAFTEDKLRCLEFRPNRTV